MKLLKVKKIWNSLFGKTRTETQEEIDWESENTDQFGNNVPKYDITDFYLNEKRKWNALVKWAEENNKQLYLDGCFGYGYRLQIKDKNNEITESK